MAHNPLISFYLGETPDHAGRYLQDYWLMDDVEMERRHDYIQWMFPSWVRSRFHPEAPILDEEVHAAFLSNATLRSHLMKSYQTMLRFYGLTDTGAAIEEGMNFSQRSQNWLTRGNHNHLRLTRILATLYTLGFPQESQKLFQRLQLIARKHPQMITTETLAFWKDAARWLAG